MRNPWQWLRAHASKLSSASGDQPGQWTGTTLVLGTFCEVNAVAAAGWRVIEAANLDEAQSMLAREEIPVVLCERDAPGADWKHAVRALAGSQGHPSVVLLTSTGPQPRWDEVAAAGGYDVLREPVTAELLERTLRSARSHWRSQRALESEPRRDASTR